MSLEPKPAERRNDALPVLTMGGAGLFIERVDEPDTPVVDKKPVFHEKPVVDEKPEVDEKPVIDERPEVDEKRMRFEDVSSSPTPEPDAEAQSKPKPARKLTLPAATQWSKDKSRTLFKSFWLLLVRHSQHGARFFALT